MLGIIIQARTGSTRLPKKMLLPFYKEKCLLDIIIDRIKQFNISGKIVLATSTKSEDDVLAEIASKHDINCFRGSENDVLLRFTEAAKFYGIDRIVRVCADNPFLDKDFFVSLIQASDKEDYCSFYIDDSLPVITTHFGFFAEFVSLKALENVIELTDEKIYREHVTNYIYTNPCRFIIKKLPLPKDISNNLNIRFTIDTLVDFEICKAIYTYFCDNGIEISASRLIEFVNKNNSFQEQMEKQIALNGK